MPGQMWNRDRPPPAELAQLASLWQQLNARGLPNLWVPSERDFYEVGEIPILGTGKLDLKKVKEMALERAKGVLEAR